MPRDMMQKPRLLKVSVSNQIRMMVQGVARTAGIDVSRKLVV